MQENMLYFVFINIGAGHVAVVNSLIAKGENVDAATNVSTLTLTRDCGSSHSTLARRRRGDRFESRLDTAS